MSTILLTPKIQFWKENGERIYLFRFFCMYFILHNNAIPQVLNATCYVANSFRLLHPPNYTFFTSLTFSTHLAIPCKVLNFDLHVKSCSGINEWIRIEFSEASFQAHKGKSHISIPYGFLTKQDENKRSIVIISINWRVRFSIEL